MLKGFRGDIIYPAVMLAGGLGLRRSEALGARWSRVDWEKKTILLDTKIIEYKENGKVIVEPVGGNEKQIQPPHAAVAGPGV